MAWGTACRIACITLCAAAMTLLARPLGAAAQGHVVLEWGAPAECPDASVLVRSIEALLEGSSRTGEPMRVRALVHRSRGRLVLRVTMGGADRELRARRCDALVEAGALVIALAIDPEAIARAAGGDGSPAEAPRIDEGEEEAAPVDTVDGDARDREAGTSEATELGGATHSEARRTDEDARIALETGAESPPHADVQMVLGVLAGIGVGALPAASPGVLGWLGVRIAPVEITLGGYWLAESSASVDGRRGGIVDLASGRARVAVLFELGMFELGPSVALEVGAMWARGVGVSAPQARTAPWVALAVGADGRLRFTRELSMVVAIDLQIPMSAPRFVIDVEGTSTRIGVFEPLPVALVGGLGLAAQFP